MGASVKFLYEDSKGKSRALETFETSSLLKSINDVKKLCLTTSFGTLLVEVTPRQRSQISLLVNGVDTQLRELGGVSFARIILDRDLFFSRVSIISQPTNALTVDINVEHHYFPAGSSEKEGVVKWTAELYKSEYRKYQKLFVSANQKSVLPDSENFGITLNSSDADQVLIQVIGRIELLLASATFDEVRADFHSTVLGDFNRDAILSSIKQNHRHLTPDIRGILNFKGQRFTTALGHRHLRNSATIDLSEVSSLLTACAGAVKQSAAPQIASTLLMTLVSDISYRFSTDSVSPEAFGEVLDLRMHSAFGAALQDSLRVLVGVIARCISRDQNNLGLLWLRQSVQDRDVFQTSVFACCAKALGFNELEISSGNGILSRGNIHIADANTISGKEFFEKNIVSWRATSVQPSGYHPDTFIFWDGVPVIVDAKFRIGASVGQVANADGLKDVQAYMDDFGLESSIVVVPRILNQKAIEPEGYALIQGHNKCIYVVSLQDSDATETLASMRLVTALAAKQSLPISMKND